MLANLQVNLATTCDFVSLCLGSLQGVPLGNVPYLAPL